MVGLAKPQHGKMFRDMLVFDTVRGFDSAGVALVPRDDNKNISLEKELGAPQNIWDWAVSDIMNNRGVIDTPFKAVIGHNRAATVGKVTAENAHPFNYGNIWGAHNGSLTNWYGLEGYHELDVDSKAIFNTIDKKGIDHTWKSFLGAAALSYWNDEDGTLNLIRNEQRPLTIAYSKDGNTVFWASEAWMINVAAARNEVELRERTDEKGGYLSPIFTLQAHMLHVFKPTATSVELVEVRELEKKSWGQQTQNHCGATVATGKNTSHIVAKSTKKGKPVKINSGWAGKLLKAPKDVRGQEAELMYVSSISWGTQVSGVANVVVFSLEDGSRMELYPSTMAEFQKWKELSLGSAVLYYKVIQRPRVTKSAQGVPHYVCGQYAVKLSRSTIAKEQKESTKKSLTTVPKVDKKVARKTEVNDTPKVLSLVEARNQRVLAQKALLTEAPKSDFTNEPMYSYWNKGAVTERRWNELCNQMSPKHACLGCSGGLDITEHKEIVWVSAGNAVCPTCAEDPTVMQAISEQLNF